MTYLFIIDSKTVVIDNNFSLLYFFSETFKEAELKRGSQLNYLFLLLLIRKCAPLEKGLDHKQGAV